MMKMARVLLTICLPLIRKMNFEDESKRIIEYAIHNALSSSQKRHTKTLQSNTQENHFKRKKGNERYNNKLIQEKKNRR